MSGTNFCEFSISPLTVSVEYNFFFVHREGVQYIDDPGVERIATAILYSSGHSLASCIETKVTVGHSELWIEAREARQGDYFPMKVSLDFFSD